MVSDVPSSLLLLVRIKIQLFYAKKKKQIKVRIFIIKGSFEISFSLQDIVKKKGLLSIHVTVYDRIE